MRRIGRAHTARYHTEELDLSCCTDTHPRCAKAADRGTPALCSIALTSVSGAHRGPDERTVIVPPAALGNLATGEVAASTGRAPPTS